VNWYVKVLKQYADFSGRARRKEYWMFALINAIIVIVLQFVDGLLGTGMNTAAATGTGVSFGVSLGILSGLYSLAVLLPGLAVAVRRLHDTDRSGWWLLIALVPLVGGIVLLVFFVLAGTAGQNKYGADPKAEAAVGAY
jgi:uncharacterized membrane protein YhaH (DUF805 family)